MRISISVRHHNTTDAIKTTQPARDNQNTRRLQWTSKAPRHRPMQSVTRLVPVKCRLEDALNALPNSEGATNFRTSKWKFFRWRRFVRYAKVGGKYLLAAKALRGAWCKSRKRDCKWHQTRVAYDCTDMTKSRTAADIVFLQSSQSNGTSMRGIGCASASTKYTMLRNVRASFASEYLRW